MRAGVEPAVLRLYDEFDTIVAGTHGDEAESGTEAPEPSLPEKLVKEAAGRLKQGAWAPSSSAPASSIAPSTACPAAAC